MSEKLTTAITICSSLLALIPALSGLIDVSIAVRLSIVAILLAIGIAALAERLTFRYPDGQIPVVFRQTSAELRRTIAAVLARTAVFSVAVGLAIFALISTIEFHNVIVKPLTGGNGMVIRAPHIPVKLVTIRPPPQASRYCAPRDVDRAWRADIDMADWPGPAAQARISEFVYPQSVQLLCGGPLASSEVAVIVEPTTASAVDQETIREGYLWLGSGGLMTIIGGAFYIARFCVFPRQSL